MRIRSIIFYLLVIVGILFPMFTFAAAGSIDPTNRISWLCKGEPGNTDCHDHTLVNWRITPPVDGTDPVAVGDYLLSGWVFSSQIGWIHLAPSITSTTWAGVQNDDNGNLSGYGWGISGSWVNFNPSNATGANTVPHGVQIDPTTGDFSGWAWVQNYGWMLFDCSHASDGSTIPCVQTDWRPTALQSGLTVYAPTASSTAGTYTSAQTVSLSSTNATSIRYTTDGTSPTCSTGTVFSSGIAVATSTTIKAIGCTTTAFSSVAEFDYIINIPLPASTPIATPGAGTYTSVQSVSITSANATTVRYTADGSDPTCSTGIVFDGTTPISVATSETLKAIGCSVGGQSSVASFAYIINLPLPATTPSGTPAPGTYSSEQFVHLSSTNADSIYYTNDGSTPACSPATGTLYNDSNPIDISSSETIQAIGCSLGGNSSVATLAYTITIAVPPSIYPPQSSLSSGTYAAVQNITLSSTNSTSIRYTIGDLGSLIAPDCFSGVIYSGAIPINSSATVRAIGCGASGAHSDVSSFDYVINLGGSLGTINNTATTSTTTLGIDLTQTKDVTVLTIATTTSPTINAVINVTNQSIAKVSHTVRNSAIATQEAFTNPENVTKIQTITTTGVVAGGAVTVTSGLLFSSFSLADILLLPLRLWSLLLGALGFTKRKKPWGVVYDSVTKQPLDPAYVVLKSMEGLDVATAITDLDGRYGFVVPEPGNYSLYVQKTNYMFPSQKLVGQDHDELYRDLYFGEHFSITTSGEFVAKNVPMDPEKFDWNEFAKKSQHLMKFYSVREKWFSRISLFFFAVGFIVSSLAVLFAMTKGNIAIFLLYVVLFFVRVFGLKSRPFGSIISKETKQPIPYTIIRISQASTGVEIMHRVTDAIGRYYCLLPNGDYFVKVEQKLPDATYKVIAEKIPAKVTKGYLSEKFEL